MSWQKLNRFELKAMRQLFFSSSAEAGEHIAGFKGKRPDRSWQRWESGDHPIPEDVDAEIYALVSQRNECLAGIIEAGENEQPQKWYPDFESFVTDFPGNNEVWWRLYQSVVAELFSEGGDVELLADIETDKSSYVYRFFSATREEDIEFKKAQDKFD